MYANGDELHNNFRGRKNFTKPIVILCLGEAKGYRMSRYGEGAYAIAKQRLQDLYGRDYHIAQHWVEKLLDNTVICVTVMF